MNKIHSFTKIASCIMLKHKGKSGLLVEAMPKELKLGFNQLTLHYA